MVRPSEKSAYPRFMIKPNGPTIGRQLRISRCGEENTKCSALNPQGPLNAPSQSKPPSKMCSQSNVISSHAASSSCSAKPRLPSGGNTPRQTDRRNGCHHSGPIKLTYQCRSGGCSILTLLDPFCAQSVLSALTSDALRNNLIRLKS